MKNAPAVRPLTGWSCEVGQKESSTRRQLLALQRLVNGFEIESINRRHGVLTFRCTQFDSRSRLWDSCGSRPGMCRDYPQNLLDPPTPEFFRGCGFRPIVQNAEGLSRPLPEAGVAPEILADLKKSCTSNKIVARLRRARWQVAFGLWFTA